MNLETKCPHCDQWTASDVESCSKCGGLLFDPKQETTVHAYKILASLVKIIKGFVNSSISSLKKNWKLVTGLSVAVLILFVLVRKSDLSGQLGFYGQWDEDKDGYLNGTEIAAAMTEMNKVEVHSLRDINGESHLIKFRWEPPRDINLDQRLSREEFTQAARRYYPLFEEYDLNKDDLLSRVEIEKEPVLDKTGFRRKQLHFEPLKKFDLNQDGKLALLEIPPYHLYSSPFGMNSLGGGSASRGSGRVSRGSSISSTSRYTPEQIAAYRKKREEDARPSGRGGGDRTPGALVLNDELTRFDAETLQDLVDAGLYDSMEDLQATAPDGTKWVLNPDGTVTTQRK